MRWQTYCVMMVVFRSWSLAVQILVREQIDARQLRLTLRALRREGEELLPERWRLLAPS